MPVEPESLVIGLPTFNRAERILPTLRALAALDPARGRITRVVIVDNRSTDSTAAVVDRFIAASPPLPMERIYEPSPGRAEALHRLFAATHEPIIATIDDDCVPDPAWAAALLACFDAHPRAGAVGGRVDLDWQTGPTPIAERYKALLAWQDLGPARTRLHDPERQLVGASLALRRRALLDSGWLERRELVGRQGATLLSGEDAELCIRIRRARWELWYEPAARLLHQMPPERQTLDYLRRLRHTISLSEPLIKWLAHGSPGGRWAYRLSRRAKRQWLKTWFLEWRPERRAMRLAERRGRLQGWKTLLDRQQQSEL